MAYRPGVSSKFVAVCGAVTVYALVITVRLFSADLYCRQSCLERESTGAEVSETLPPWEEDMSFEGFNNESGTLDGHYIVPNYVHFVKFGEAEFSFVHAVCVLAAFKNQRPERLYFHTDLDGFQGYYWEVMMNVTGIGY